jgi:hypothetical protein
MSVRELKVDNNSIAKGNQDNIGTYVSHLTPGEY